MKPFTPEQIAGRELRRLRIARGWSQEQVAEEMNAYGYDWHQTLVGRIEGGQRPLRLNEAVDLAALFGVTLEMLLARTQRAGQREVDAERVREDLIKAEEELAAAERAARAAAAQSEEIRIAYQGAESSHRVAQAEAARAHGRVDQLRTLLRATEEQRP